MGAALEGFFWLNHLIDRKEIERHPKAVGTMDYSFFHGKWSSSDTTE